MMKKDDNLIIKYRKATVVDAQSIVGINLQMWRTTYRNLVSSKTIEARFLTNDKRVETAIEQISTNNTYIVAEIDNRVIGFIQYIQSNNKDFEDYGVIQALCILDEYQRIGIGKVLFNLALSELRKLGFKRIFLDCLVGNSANDFYLKMGTTIHSVKEELFMDEILVDNIHVMNI